MGVWWEAGWLAAGGARCSTRPPACPGSHLGGSCVCGAEALQRLGGDFPGEFIQGVALETTVLEAAGIERADAFVAATNGDNTNLVIAQIARDRYQVQCVIVRVLDPARARFYEERGLVTVCPTRTAIDRMSEALRAFATADGEDA